MATDADLDKMSGAEAAGVATRAAALRLLDAVLRKGLPLESALDSAARGLDRADDRAFAHALAAAVLRHLADLDALIDGATAKPLPRDAKARAVLRIALAQALALGTPGHAAIATVLPLVDGGPRRLVHGVFGTLLRRGAALPPTPTLPADVVARWTAAWGEEMVVAAAGIAAGAPLDLTLRDAAETATWAERLDGVSLTPSHVRLAARTRVTTMPGYEEGAFWVQDLAASLPARLIGAGDGGRALDLCAAPGGKTMQLAAAGWRVTALDLAAGRLDRLRENLARTRLEATIVEGDALTYVSPEPVDAVLLDAPCSATGTFRRHPDVLHRVRARGIVALAERQRAMLARAAQALRPGGRLVYAVCSLEPEEGEAVAADFVRSHAGFVTEPVAQDELPPGIVPTAEGWVRVLPTMIEADGFFVARFRKR